MNAYEEFAQSFSLTVHQLRMLSHMYATTEVITCLELLKAKKHRSSFRAGLASRLRMWLKMNEGHPINDALLIARPLSPSQLKAALPRWPVNYNIPKYE